ncbi:MULTISPECIES: protein disulfide oxidoreductase [Vibrio]|uniref:protein disulfide oxidoreductase n=1 Tax=Vibrio TaxID=662 RepID=UPI003D0E16D7
MWSRKKSNKASVKGWRRHVREWAAIIMVMVVVTIVIDSYRTRDMPQSDLPALSGKTLDGQWVDVLEESKQAPVIVYFWATWCPACKFVTPTIDWFSNHYKVIGVSVSSGSDARVNRFMASQDRDFANINDPKGELMNSWSISVTPTIVIINNGKIESMTTGVTTPMGLFARMMML